MSMACFTAPLTLLSWAETPSSSQTDIVPKSTPNTSAVPVPVPAPSTVVAVNMLCPITLRMSLARSTSPEVVFETPIQWELSFGVIFLKLPSLMSRAGNNRGGWW